MPIFKKSLFEVEYNRLIEIIFAWDGSSSSVPANVFLRHMPTHGHDHPEVQSDK